jgi:hypothetical protein
LGEVLFNIMLLLLSAALGVMPIDEIGEMHISTGEVTGALEIGDSGLRISLAQQYRLVQVDVSSSSARVEVEEATTGLPNSYDLILGEQVIMGAHRVHLEALLPSGVVLGLERRHLLYWKLIIGVGMLCALGLFVFIPHRSWVWLGHSGSYVIRLWSLNRKGTLERWILGVLGKGLVEAADLTRVKPLDVGNNRLTLTE